MRERHPLETAADRQPQKDVRATLDAAGRPFFLFLDTLEPKPLGDALCTRRQGPVRGVRQRVVVRLRAVSDSPDLELAVRALKTLLAVNGLVFLIRALLNVFRPTSFYLESGAPEYASDAVRVLGITYGVLGFIQLGMWRVSDRRAVVVVSSGSLLFAAGVAVQAMTQEGSSTDSFHQMRLASAAENVAVAALYAFLLYREHQSATHFHR